jgi:hypothetical protein
MEPHPAVASFRDWLIGEYRSDGAFEGVQVRPRAGVLNVDLALCLDVGSKSYYDVRLDLDGRQLQVGFATESRAINESVEQMVLDNGGDLGDLLADELVDLGEEPLPMEHFFERPAFRFTTRLPLEGPESLQDPSLRRRVKVLLKACRVLFQESVDEA